MTYESVLIVEDDSCRMRLIRDAFRHISPQPQITGVDNLADATKAALEKRYGLYFCDCDFPLVPKSEDPRFKAKTGAFFDFYESLIQVHPNPNVIVCSNFSENIKRAREMGLTAYLKGEKTLHEIITGEPDLF